LRVENVLQNYDEFASLKELQSVDMTDPAAVEAFKAKHYLSDDDLTALQAITLPAERKIQDYRSTYNDVRDWLRREKSSAEKEKSTIDWDDVVFEVDLLKSQEINLDYILELIFEHNKKIKSKSELVDEVRRVIRASLGNRAKESLLVDFINQTDLDQIGDKASVIDAFFTFAQAEQQREAQELISTENLNAEAARRYITTSLKREFASDSGTELNAVLPKMSPLNPQYLTKKQSVFPENRGFCGEVQRRGRAGGTLPRWHFLMSDQSKQSLPFHDDIHHARQGSQTMAIAAPAPSPASKTESAFLAPHYLTRAHAPHSCAPHTPPCPRAKGRENHQEMCASNSCSYPIETML
jgi:hypothetical protein